MHSKSLMSTYFTLASRGGRELEAMRRSACSITLSREPLRPK
ncbi:MAG: hypothetical protein N3F67_06230 [Acidilobaceae archaeon]|nr:hypothetical protein [Acidilobaceae archaeon]